MPQWLGITGIRIRLLKRKDRFAYLRRFSVHVCKALGVANKHSESLLLQQRLIHKQTQRCYVICRSTDIIGALHVLQRKDTMPLLYCWLHEHFWARGLFKRCVRIVCADVGKAWGATTVAAHIDADNLRSLYAFYKAGFTCVRTDKLQYHLIVRLCH